MTKLGDQLASLDPALRARIDARGFDAERLAQWAADIGNSDERNRLSGSIQPVTEVAGPPDQPDERARLAALGNAALDAGELAICVLAGGMATRMGGVVKALVPCNGAHTFLDLRLAEQRQLGERHGSAPPLWLMTSEPTDGPIRDALGAAHDGETIGTFEQFVSLRLDAADGGLFLEDGQPSVYATGHGDLPDALQKSGMIGRFVEGGGRYVWISNLDNLGASVDPVLLGWHIDHEAQLTVELVAKHEGDKGGGPVVHDGRTIITEHFRLPLGFDADAIPVFNTNTFLADARALAQLTMDWTYVEVRKQVGDRQAVQFERLVGEMTSHIDTSLLQVSREGDASRFLPMKTHDDLRTHQAAIARIAASRGL